MNFDRLSSVVDSALKPTVPDIMKVVTERVRSTFAQLIPDEVFARLVQAEVDELIKPSIQVDRYGRPSDTPVSISPLQQMLRKAVHARVEAELGERVRERVDTLTADGRLWDPEHTPDEALEQIIERLAPRIWQSMMADFIKQTVARLHAESRTRH